VLTRDKENFVGALSRPQALSLWKAGLCRPASQVIGIGLVQFPNKPFLIDFHLNIDVDLLKVGKKFEAVVDDHEYECELLLPKDPPPKLGEEVTITIPKTRFKLKPEQIDRWIGRFGVVVSSTKFVEADDLRGMNTDDLTCVAKLRKHIPGVLPAFGRKLSIRYPGQPLQCNKCYMFGHLRKACEKEALEWVNYVKAFVDEVDGIVTRDMIGEWQRIL